MRVKLKINSFSMSLIEENIHLTLTGRMWVKEHESENTIVTSDLQFEASTKRGSGKITYKGAQLFLKDATTGVKLDIARQVRDLISEYIKNTVPEKLDEVLDKLHIEHQDK